jgi:tryptophanyl-tRNA synthetase
MSKSYGNTIPLFASKDELSKLVMSIVTDSGAGIPENVYAIHKLIRSEADLKTLYQENSGKYRILKEALLADLEAFISPLRAKREELAKNPDVVREVLESGKQKANEIASAKLNEVKQKIGVI